MYTSPISNVDLGEQVIPVVYTPKHQRRIVDIGVHSCAVACTSSYIYDRSGCDPLSILPRPTSNQVIGALPNKQNTGSILEVLSHVLLVEKIPVQALVYSKTVNYE